MLNIKQNLEEVRKRICNAEEKYHRKPGSVKLIAVSKTKPVNFVHTAIEAEQYLFGESYVQEAADKIHTINNPLLEWHFLGPIQSNKTRIIATNFNWVHSVDRLKIVQRLNDQRPQNLPRLNVCIQINISQENSKSGISEDNVSSLVDAVLGLPNICLRGFMVIPQKAQEFHSQRAPFKAAKKIKEDIEHQYGITLDTLSMGMSTDLEAAIAEGASHVRIGTDIFGAR